MRLIFFLLVTLPKQDSLSLALQDNSHHAPIFPAWSFHESFLPGPFGGGGGGGKEERVGSSTWGRGWGGLGHLPGGRGGGGMA